MNNDQFAGWFRRQLSRREWSQSDLSRRLGISTGTISRWATGNRLPDPESVEKLADVFGVDVADRDFPDWEKMLTEANEQVAGEIASMQEDKPVQRHEH